MMSGSSWNSSRHVRPTPSGKFAILHLQREAKARAEKLRPNHRRKNNDSASKKRCSCCRLYWAHFTVLDAYGPPIPWVDGASAKAPPVFVLARFPTAIPMCRARRRNSDPSLASSL
eukprot:scaffold218685_cov30-Tisochrysis_lutea.AAC.1